MRLYVLASLLLLAGCASAPPPDTRYWEDPAWFDAFKASISVPYPVIVVKDSWPAGTAHVGFDYVDGYVQSVKILGSTGDIDLDHAVVAGLVNTFTPDRKAHIRRQPHHFEMEIPLAPTTDDFKTAVRWTVELKLQSLLGNQRLDPKPDDPLVLSVDYRDGKFVDAKIVRSTGNADVDAMARASVLQAAGPPPLPELRGKDVVFMAHFCFVTPVAGCGKLTPTDPLTSSHGK